MLPALPLLAKNRIIAPPGFNRWLVPPAALAIHLCIGMAYGFSVFWLPLSRAVGITESAPSDWKISTLGWMYTLFFVMLGSSAALFGEWVEREGPRKAGVVAACCWGGGFFMSALGVYMHQLWLLWLGSGVIGGCGLGLGYISPVSTLIKWFPDRRGMATGLAIMGFGGGAMIGAPLADQLMRRFATPTSVGVWQTFVVLGVLYFACHAGRRLRLSPAGARLAAGGMDAARHAAERRARGRHDGAHRVDDAAVLAAVGRAVPERQRRHRRARHGVADDPGDVPGPRERVGGGGFHRPAEPVQHRRPLLLGVALGSHRPQGHLRHLLPARHGALRRVPTIGTRGSLVLFVAMFSVILTMYGGGFATIPAYLADLFGTGHVSAIHGRLLTAWSTAGILGPVLVNYIREFQIERGVPPAQAYDVTMYILAGFLVVGFVCNLAVRPVPSGCSSRTRAHEGHARGGAQRAGTGRAPSSRGCRAQRADWSVARGGHGLAARDRAARVGRVQHDGAGAPPVHGLTPGPSGGAQPRTVMRARTLRRGVVEWEVATDEGDSPRGRSDGDRPMAVRSRRRRGEFVDRLLSRNTAGTGARRRRRARYRAQGSADGGTCRAGGQGQCDARSGRSN